MTHAEFRSRFEGLGVVVQGGPVPTELVRDQGRVIRMAHTLGPKGGTGTLRLAALNRLSKEAAQKIVERCVVDGVCVLITQNLDNFVDFDQWMASNEGPPGPASEVFGPRVDTPVVPIEAPVVAEEPPRVKTATQAPRPTELFGPAVTEAEVNAARARREAARDAGPAPNPKEKPGASNPPLPQSRTTDARPRVFWRDLRETPSGPTRPFGTEYPHLATVPSADQSARTSDVPATSQVDTAEREPGVAYPTPLPSYRVEERPAQSKPASLNTMLQSLPRIPIPSGLVRRERYTEVIAGRKQGELGGAAAPDAAEDEDQSGGIPKWAIIAMVVVAILAVVFIVVGILT